MTGTRSSTEGPGPGDRVGRLPCRRGERAAQCPAASGQSMLGGFIGGCHLTGPIIEPTVEAFSAANIGRILPAHCTGWKAVHLFARAMPAAFAASRRDRRHLLRKLGGQPDRYARRQGRASSMRTTPSAVISVCTPLASASRTVWSPSDRQARTIGPAARWPRRNVSRSARSATEVHARGRGPTGARRWPPPGR